AAFHGFRLEATSTERTSMSVTRSEAVRLPLTQLTEDEAMFRDAVRQFAEETVAPLVGKMDEEAQLDPTLLPQLFELGLMGVEIPDSLGGTGANFFTSVLVVEELSRVDPSVGVLVDVQNTLVNNCILRWGTEEQKERLL